MGPTLGRILFLFCKRSCLIIKTNRRHPVRAIFFAWGLFPRSLSHSSMLIGQLSNKKEKNGEAEGKWLEGGEGEEKPLI